MSAVLTETARPRLPRGVRPRFDDTRDSWLLLAPERTLRLDAIGAAIVTEIDGKRTLADLVDLLAAKYAAPRPEILADVLSFLESLMDRRMLEVD